MNTAAFRYVPPPNDVIVPLYCDAVLLVVDKPEGLLAVPGRGDDKFDCLATRVQAEHPDALIVHRLDMATSGLMVMARGKKMHSRISHLFQTRQVHKRYIAVVDGRLPAASGEIDLPLIVDWPNRPRQKIDFDTGRPSLTRYRLLHYDAATDTSRVELEPVTGRTHQLRVHMQYLGHPIVGDPLYAGEAAQGKATRLLLHAASLAFPHPITAEPLRFSSPPPF